MHVARLDHGCSLLESRFVGTWSLTAVQEDENGAHDLVPHSFKSRLFSPVGMKQSRTF